MHALTRTGEFHLTRLRLNRAALVAHRREQNLLLQEREHQKTLLERIVQLAQRIERLQLMVSALVPKSTDNGPA